MSRKIKQPRIKRSG